MRYRMISFRIELAKLLRGKHNILLLILSLIPLCYCVLVVKSAAAFQAHDLYDLFSFITYGFIIMNAIMIYNVYMIVVTTHSMYGEIDGGTIKLLINQFGSRKMIYQSKSRALCTYYAFLTIGYLILVTLLYAGLYSCGFPYLSGDIYQRDTASDMIYIFFSIFLTRLLMIKFVLFLSIYFRKAVTYILYFVAYCIVHAANYFNMIHYATPMYYIKYFKYGIRHGEQFIMKMILCYFLISFVIDFIGRRAFDKKQL